MKTLLFLFCFNSIIAQQVAIGFDFSNAIQGSDVNAPALNIQAKISDITTLILIGLI